MPFRDFDPQRREGQRALDPVKFRVGGEEFVCIERPTLADTFDLLDAPEPFAGGSPVASGVRAVTLFIERLLVNRRAKRRWRKLLRRRKDVIDASTIVELGAWISEQYADRPTVPSTSSSGGRPDTDQNSTSSRFATDLSSVT